VSSVRECHAVLSGALSAALRWGWISVNPLEAVKRPRQKHPQPDPPSTEEAARIVSAAWEQDADWGCAVPKLATRCDLRFRRRYVIVA
jgi:integrase